MLKNYFITTLRNLSRNKTNTAINIIGLSMGISCAIVLFLLADFAKSYNDFEQNKDRIYRIVCASKGQNGETKYTEGVPVPFVKAVKEEFPDFEQVILTRDHYLDKLFTANPSSSTPQYFELNEKRLAYASQGYFNIFSRKVLEGDLNTALSEPGGTVISKSVADLMFPAGNALGQNIVFNKKEELVIEAIVEDQVSNSDMPFDIIISTETKRNEFDNATWSSISSNDQCYVLLPEGMNPDLSLRLKNLVDKYFDENHNEREYFMQPLSDLHYNKNWGNYSYKSMSKNQILILIIIGLFLLLTASVNFINLSTAVGVKRSKEVGIRKVLGSTKSQLSIQFLGESFCIVLISSLAALGLAEMMIVYINPFLEVNLSIDFFNLQMLLVFIIGILSVTILAGFYPAIVLSNYKPVQALKGLINHGSHGRISFRKGLVVFQFFISQVFIIGTIIIIYQMNYIQNINLGFNTDAIINVRIPELDISKEYALRNEIEKLSGVTNVSLNFSPPSSGNVSISNFKIEGNANRLETAMKFVDENYLDTYGITLLAGRNIEPSDTIREVIVNQEFLKYINHKGTYDDALGMQINIWGKDVPIVGVVKDFFSVSLHDKLTSLAIFCNAASYFEASIKVNMNAFDETNDRVKQIWKSLYPEYNYDFNFYDKEIAEFYESEQKMTVIFSFFSTIAILVGCMGLFGLASSMINSKIKEIGVRKTLGASVKSIVGMFSLTFFKLIALAFLMAAPLVWYAMNQWLQNFEYHIILSPVLFSFGLISALIVAGFTVGYISVKAAMTNPVDSLKDE